MSPFDHILLYCLLYFVAECFERQKNARIPMAKFLFVAQFVLVEGLRYGRGPDFKYVYGPEYLKCLTNNLLREDMDPLYMLIIKSVRSIDPFVDALPFGAIFMVYALIFVFCLLKLYSSFKNSTKHFFLFALLATLFLLENPIRTGIGFSFMLSAIYFLSKTNFGTWKTDKNLRWAILFLLIPPFIHKGDALGCVLILTFCLLFDKKVISWKISLPILLIFELSSAATGLMNTLFGYLSGLDMILGADDKMQHYLDYSTFENEMESSLDGQRSVFTQILAIGYYSSMIIVGYIVSKAKRHSVWIYNLFVCSILIAEPFRLLGSLVRMFTPTSVLWFIPMSIAAYYYNEFKSNKIFVVCYWFFIAYLTMYFGRFVFLNPEAQYVWSINPNLH